MSNTEDAENAVEKVITQILEIRKQIDNILQFGKKNFYLNEIKEKKRFKIDVFGWNELGLYFLNNKMYSDALLVYQHMLDSIIEIESKKGLEIHKGLPLYNIGIAQINLKNYDEGIPNVLRAYDEDVKSFGARKANTSLAKRVEEGLIEFVSRVIDNNYLADFNRETGLQVTDTFSLMQNMNDVEKLFFVKIVNSKKLIKFHDDLYTKVVMFDNLKNLCLILESNLRRRLSRTENLSPLIEAKFDNELWINHFTAQKQNFTHYNGVTDFEQKINTIRTSTFSTNSSENFKVRNFLTIALVRNFGNHYLNENLGFLLDEQKYDDVFSKEIFSIMYSLR